MAELPSKNKRYFEDKKRKQFNCHQNYALKKLPPTKFPQSKTDIYFTLKTNFSAIFDKCEKLLKSGEEELCIHGLGAALPQAINLSLKLQQKFFGAFDISVNTSTVYLTDEFEPLNDQVEAHSQTRPNSAVHIRIFKK